MNIVTVDVAITFARKFGGFEDDGRKTGRISERTLTDSQIPRRLSLNRSFILCLLDPIILLTPVGTDLFQSII
jgi:hypothetical protein